MNGRLYSLPAKTAAVILFIVFAIVTALFGVAFVYMCSGAGYYSSADSEETFYDSELCSSLAYREYNHIADSVSNTSDAVMQTLKNNIENEYSFSSGNAAAYVVIKDFNGSVVAEIGSVPDSYGYNVSGVENFISADGKSWRSADISVYIRKPIADYSDDFSEYKRYSDLFFSIRYAAIAVTSLGAISLVSLYVYLMKSAGRRYGESGVSEGFADRIPYDIFLAAAAVLIYIITMFAGDVINGYGWFYGTSSIYGAISILAILCIPLLLIFLALSATTAVRMKVRTLFRNTVIWRICALICKLFRALWRGLRGVATMVPHSARTALLFPAYLLANFILIALSFNVYSEFGIFILLLMLAALNLTAYIFAIRSAYELALLRRGSARLADGEPEYKFDECRLHGEARKISVNLNRMGNGLSAAVEQRLKSERMKAELITNVSHDLKTPITSIINYVDLLKKEPMQTEAASGYLVVLDRQSARLRKLTSDLIEASKASTGNIEATLAPTDICELLNQSAAEYADRFAAAGLSPVVRTPGSPVVINADGKLLWRVFDNLLSNICKYSQPGTRVYLDATAGERFTCVSMRNISSVQLEVSLDELTERFVRGDSSRTGDGSGLGLSIARSLTELQGGKLTLEVDGDLFKVMVTFPVAV